VIDRVAGTLIARDAGAVVIDLGGIALRVEVSQTCAERLGPLGGKVALLTQLMMVGQDAQPRLYGFATPEARQLFHLLRGVSGIGPSMAVRILGAQPTPADVAAAIARGDGAGIKVKGVGPKIAKRVITELQPKVSKVLTFIPEARVTPSGNFVRPEAGDRELEDAFLALKGLEFDPARARQLLAEIRQENAEASADQLVRQVLLRA
jgi:Holliday junction DNA helicase RuvA